MINQEVENVLYDILKEKVSKHKAQMIAWGSTTDHIHILLSISPETCIAMLVKEIKGASSFFINHKTKGNLYWQDGYGVLSVSKSGIETVRQYVEKQKEHHQESYSLIQILEKHA